MNTEIKRHPSEKLKQEWINLLRRTVLEEEQKGWLSPDVLDLFVREKWFLALVPRQYGGLEWSLPEIVAFEEAIGWAEGSAGWVFTLCSGAGWFGGFLDQTYAANIFSQEHACLAGSGAIGGTAELLPDGLYVVNGTWPYASGAPAATVFTANCQVTKGQIPLLQADGEPVVLSFCFDRTEVNILPTWQQLGLRASASHSFTIKNVIANEARSFVISELNPSVAQLLYRFPFMPLAYATIGANISGMAIHFLEEFEAFIREKNLDNTEAQSFVKQAFATLNDVRMDLFNVVTQVWMCMEQQLVVDIAIIEIAARKLVRTARDIVNTAYPYCGLTITSDNTILGKCWRDFQTGSQHKLFL